MIGVAFVVLIAGILVIAAVGRPVPGALWLTGGVLLGALLGILISPPNLRRKRSLGRRSAASITRAATDAATARAHEIAAAAASSDADREAAAAAATEVRAIGERIRWHHSVFTRASRIVDRAISAYELAIHEAQQRPTPANVQAQPQPLARSPAVHVLMAARDAARASRARAEAAATGGGGDQSSSAGDWSKLASASVSARRGPRICAGVLNWCVAK
jgi:hypothetical protein